MRGEFVDVGGARLYYYAAGTRGEGEPVVFLHGFPTSGHMWSEIVPLMPRGHRLVVVDLLGYGRSDRPEGRELGIAAHGRRTLALLDQLGINYAAVVGHDLGGGIAQWLAVHAPTRVSRLALIDTVAFDDWPVREVKLARATMPLTRHLPPNLLLPMVKLDLLRGYVDDERGRHSLALYMRPFSSPEGRDALMQHLVALDASETEALAPRLRSLVQPAAVIWAARDPWFPPAIGERLAATIPGATFHLLDEVRHFCPEEAPEQIASILAQLLQR